MTPEVIAALSTAIVAILGAIPAVVFAIKGNNKANKMTTALINTNITANKAMTAVSLHLFNDHPYKIDPKNPPDSTDDDHPPKGPNLVSETPEESTYVPERSGAELMGIVPPPPTVTPAPETPVTVSEPPLAAPEPVPAVPEPVSNLAHREDVLKRLKDIVAELEDYL